MFQPDIEDINRSRLSISIGPDVQKNLESKSTEDIFSVRDRDLNPGPLGWQSSVDCVVIARPSTLYILFYIDFTRIYSWKFELLVNIPEY